MLSFRLGLEKLEEKGAVDDNDDDDSEENLAARQFAFSSTTPASNQMTKLSASTLSSTAHKDNDADNDEDLPSSQTTVRTMPVETEEDEEFTIEDFDDWSFDAGEDAVCIIDEPASDSWNYEPFETVTDSRVCCKEDSGDHRHWIEWCLTQYPWRQETLGVFQPCSVVKWRTEREVT